MAKRAEPAGWGQDPMGAFLLAAQENGYAAFQSLSGPYRKLASIDSMFREALANLDRSPDWLPTLFLLRAHSSYLGAVRIALSGQIAESFMLMRGVLESSLYGYRLAREPSLAEIWLKRGDSAAIEREVREKFAWGAVRRALEAESKRIAELAHELYQRCLDHGGHPNSGAFLHSLEIEEAGSERRLRLAYLTDNEATLQFVLKSVAQIGVLSLMVARLIFKERFEIIGLSERIDRESSTL
jgi:hypothetical protein